MHFHDTSVHPSATHLSFLLYSYIILHQYGLKHAGNDQEDDLNFPQGNMYMSLLTTF